MNGNRVQLHREQLYDVESIIQSVVPVRRRSKPYAIPKGRLQVFDLKATAANGPAIVNIPSNVHKALMFARLGTDLNPVTSAASARAVKVARFWIGKLGLSIAQLPVAEVFVPGDGGIVVKWSLGNNFVSANFDSEDDYMDTLLSKFEGEVSADDFSEIKLNDLISSLLACKAPTDDFLPYPTDSSETISVDWSDYIKSSPVASLA